MSRCPTLDVLRNGKKSGLRSMRPLDCVLNHHKDNEAAALLDLGQHSIKNNWAAVYNGPSNGFLVIFNSVSLWNA